MAVAGEMSTVDPISSSTAAAVGKFFEFLCERQIANILCFGFV